MAPITFHGFMHLAPELRIEIYEQCTANALLRLRKTSRFIRSEAEHTFLTRATFIVDYHKSILYPYTKARLFDWYLDEMDDATATPDEYYQGRPTRVASIYPVDLTAAAIIRRIVLHMTNGLTRLIHKLQCEAGIVDYATDGSVSSVITRLFDPKFDGKFPPKDLLAAFPNLEYITLKKDRAVLYDFWSYDDCVRFPVVYHRPNPKSTPNEPQNWQIVHVPPPTTGITTRKLHLANPVVPKTIGLLKVPLAGGAEPWVSFASVREQMVYIARRWEAKKFRLDCLRKRALNVRDPVRSNPEARAEVEAKFRVEEAELLDWAMGHVSILVFAVKGDVYRGMHQEGTLKRKRWVHRIARHLERAKKNGLLPRERAPEGRLFEALNTEMKWRHPNIQEKTVRSMMQNMNTKDWIERMTYWHPHKKDHMTGLWASHFLLDMSYKGHPRNKYGSPCLFWTKGTKKGQKWCAFGNGTYAVILKRIDWSDLETRELGR